MTRKIWVDTDIALGAPGGDVDDGFALAAVALAAQDGPPFLEGVSVVSGNTEAATAFEAARLLLETLGASCPLVCEADAPQALAGLEPGSDGWSAPWTSSGACVSGRATWNGSAPAVPWGGTFPGIPTVGWSAPPSAT